MPIAADTLGLVLVVVVYASNQHDSPATRAVLTSLARQDYERMSKILANRTYGKKLAYWLKKSYGLILEVVKVSKLRRLSDRAHALEGGTNFYWMSWSRRFSKDYEYGINSHESFVYLSNINRMLKHF